MNKYVVLTARFFALLMLGLLCALPAFAAPIDQAPILITVVEEGYQWNGKVLSTEEPIPVEFALPEGWVAIDWDLTNEEGHSIKDEESYGTLAQDASNYIYTPPSSFTQEKMVLQLLLVTETAVVTMPILLWTIAAPKTEALGDGDNSFIFNDEAGRHLLIRPGVDFVGDKAFMGRGVTSVAIPNTVTKIGEKAFAYNKISSVEIPASVSKIGAAAFSRNELSSVTIPDRLTILSPKIFSFNKLNSLSIPNTITEIGKEAFAINGLSSVNIPDSVTKIGDSAFLGNQLSSVTIGNAVSDMGEGTFASNQLVNVNVPDSVTVIAKGVFYRNPLEEVSIREGTWYKADYSFPRSVKVIKREASSVPSIASPSEPLETSESLGSLGTAPASDFPKTQGES